MVTIYTSNSCAGCRKAKEWFKERNIDFVEKNFFTSPLKKDDLLKILKHSFNGFEDIISTRSKIFMENNLDIDSMKYNELIEFIIANPSILKRPIIIDDNKMQVGYNEEEIRAFIPPHMRNNHMCYDCDSDVCDYQKHLCNSIDKIKNELEE